MATASKVSLQNMLTDLRAAANQDQNLMIPPWVFSSWYNTVTSFLITACVEKYPDDDEVIDIIMPFVKEDFIFVKDGYAILNDDYRDLLGTPSIAVAIKDECECSEPIDNLTQFHVAIQKSRCRKVPVVIYPKSEFDYRTTSLYKAPTINTPIGYFTQFTPKGSSELVSAIKICPYDLTKIQLMYVMQEPVFKYGYITQPDETYIYDPTTSTESLWTNAAYTPLFKGLMALLGAYGRDKTITDFARILKNENIL